MNKEVIFQEIESLIRTLDFIQEEQSFIKSKLSSLLDKSVLNEDIVWAEALSQVILNRETAIQLLKSDILTLRNQVKAKRAINNIIDPSSASDFKKYKQQVGYIEAEFFTWKQNFNEKFEMEIY